MKKLIALIVILLSGIVCFCDPVKVIKSWPSKIVQPGKRHETTVVVQATINNGMYLLMIGDSDDNIPLLFIFDSEEKCIDFGQTLHVMIEDEILDASSLKAFLCNYEIRGQLIKVDGNYYYLMG